MTLDQVHLRAQQEQLSFDDELRKIKQAIKDNPDGIDIKVDLTHLNKIIAYCDKHRIPIYHVTGSCISVAPSYKVLYEREATR